MITLYAQIARCNTFESGRFLNALGAQWFNHYRTSNNFQMLYYVHFPLIVSVCCDIVIVVGTTLKLGLWTSNLHVDVMYLCGCLNDVLS